MRRVEVGRVFPAPPERVRTLLSPASVIEFEGTYQPLEVRGNDETSVVTVWPNGRLLAPRYLFERRSDGFVYRRTGEGRDFVTSEATATIEPTDGGTRLTLRATVETIPSVAILERFAAWQRRRRLARLVDEVAVRIGRGASRAEVET